MNSITDVAILAEQASGTKPRVLVVEDEYLVAMLVENMLETLGFQVAELCSNFDAATAAARSGEFDVAILDVNLNGAMSSPIAEILAGRNIPFIFATGYGKSGPHQQFAGTPSLQKPFEESDLKQALAVALGRG